MSQGLFILFTPANGAKQRPSMRMTMARLAAFPGSETLSGAVCILLPSGEAQKVKHCVAKPCQELCPAAFGALYIFFGLQRFW